MYTSAVFVREGVEYQGIAELKEHGWFLSLQLNGHRIRTLGHYSDLKTGWDGIKALLDITAESVEQPRLSGEGTDGPLGAEESQ